MDNYLYSVRGPEEVRKILELHNKLEIRSLFLSLFVKVWVSLTNISLKILKFILFDACRASKREFESIAVYTVGIVGDNVVMLPALAALRRRYPKAQITVITNCQIWDQEGAKGVLSPSPFKDQLIVLDDHPVKRKRFRFLLDDKKFEGVKCDLFVNLSPFGNRGWIGAVVREMIFAKKLGAKYAIGFKMSTYSRKGIFNKVQHRFVKNEPRRSREVLKELGLEPVENEDLLPHEEAAKESVLKKISENGRNQRPLFVINPGAKFESKCWPSEYFGEVGRWVHQKHGSTVVVTGVASEREIAQQVVRASGEFAVNLAGQTSVQELIELLRMSKGCVTNDTGTMHLAAMVGVPTVAIFSTRISPTHWLPAGDKVVSIFCIEDCSFCYKDECSDTKCLKKIDKEFVLREIRVLLSKRPGDQEFNQERECQSPGTVQTYL